MEVKSMFVAITYTALRKLGNVPVPGSFNRKEKNSCRPMLPKARSLLLTLSHMPRWSPMIDREMEAEPSPFGMRAWKRKRGATRRQRPLSRSFG
jgi:hypothetical protein